MEAITKHVADQSNGQETTRHTTAFKSRIALAALEGTKTVSHLPSKHDLHATRFEPKKVTSSIEGPAPTSLHGPAQHLQPPPHPRPVPHLSAFSLKPAKASPQSQINPQEPSQHTQKSTNKSEKKETRRLRPTWIDLDRLGSILHNPLKSPIICAIIKK